jgi:hypothetical protein
MSSKQLNIVLGIAIAVLLVTIGYMTTKNDYYSADTLNQQNTTPNTNFEDSNANAAQPLSNSNVSTQQPTPTPTDATANWKTYTEEGFSIRYPNSLSGISGNWIYDDDGLGIHFGPASTKSGGYVWAILIYDSNRKSIEALINEIGNQFTDRKEARRNIIIDNTPGVLVTVTTNQIEDWMSEAVYIEKNSKIYVISNGAIDRPEFTSFYNSIKFAR